MELNDFGYLDTIKANLEKAVEKYGEDIAFCDRVKQIGGEIWCEPTVRPGHIAQVPVYAGEHLFGGGDE